MLKYLFAFILFGSLKFYGIAAETQSSVSAFNLVRQNNMALPKAEEIRAYELKFGQIPEQLSQFYLKMGNCFKKGMDILTIQGGRESRLAHETAYIRERIKVLYHAFAVDQVDGGYWVYLMPENSNALPTLSLVDTASLQIKQTDVSFLAVLKK